MANATPFAPGLYASGQPSKHDLAELAGLGVRTIINLRGTTEPVEYDEALEAERLGLRCISVPVAGPQDITPDTVARFSRELEAARRAGDTLVHCASSNRVGALVALNECLLRGATIDQGIALGRAAGLTTLEPLVATMIREHSGT